MRAMTECPVARNSTGRMLLRETSDVPQYTDGMVELAVVVMTMNEVGDDRAGRRRGSADSSKVEQDRAQNYHRTCIDNSVKG